MGKNNATRNHNGSTKSKTIVKRNENHLALRWLEYIYFKN
jgi:hypothetical protein